MADFNKTVDLDKGLNNILDKIDKKAEEMRQRGEEVGEAFGDGWDEGFDYTIEKIKASSIKTDKAFKNLSEKIRKQVQQLTTKVNGKDTKIKIDFSDIDINSEAIQKQIARKVERIKASDLIDFDTKNFDGQLTNFVTLFMKYKGKFDSLKQAYPSISVPQDAINNLQQQLALVTELHKMFKLFNQQGEFFVAVDTRTIQKDLSKLQQFSNGVTTKSVGEYDELAKVLNEIQGSLKVISDIFKNESNSMKSMAEGGVTSFESLSQAIIGVYNNLTQVQSLVDTISQKDFNITNITNPTSTSTSKRQTVKQLKAEVDTEMEHVRALFTEYDKLISEMQSKRMTKEAYQAMGMVGGFDEGSGLPNLVEYADFEQEILEGMADAKTKAKIENLLVLIDGYIAKLTEVNKLREKYGLGAWQDPFAETSQPTIQHTTPKGESKDTTPIVETPKEVVVTGDTEIQQMSNLKGAVDEVSKAIGRKNAGFIKEQEIVNTSVEAEKAKLKELVAVIMNEIGVALDDIKLKFAQSFILPELDKTNLQSSFDEIYNKFIELQTNVSQLQFNITPQIQSNSKDPTEKSPYYAMSRHDATEYIGEHYDYELWNNWFSRAFDESRTEIAQILLNDTGLRNASLNQMWDEYKYKNNSDIPFEEFLYTKIPLYRGEPSDSKSVSQQALSFSMNKEAAESFGAVLETYIRPIDTLGMPNPIHVHNDELEVLVPKDQVINTPEYSEWKKRLNVGDSTSNTEQAIYGESQSATDTAKSFVDAANAKQQFVEANKQVAKSAKESAKAVEEEAKATEQTKKTMTAVAEDTVEPSNWDKITKFQTDHGEDPFAESRSKTENVGDKSVRTIVESWSAIRDEDGKLTGEMQRDTVKIINDYKARTEAITKENEKIKTAQAYLQKFLTQFDNKTMGKGSLLSGYQDLVNLANSDGFKIDDIAKAEQMMSNLDAEYNKVVQSMRKGSSSMNPFVNAINGMDKMEDVLKGISLQFKTLNQQPDWLNNDIIGLYKQLDNLAVETDIYKFAEGFGNLKVSINSVTESIRQQRVEQKLTLSDFKALVQATKNRDTNTEKAAKEKDGSVWKTYYLDRAAEQQKIIDAIRIGLTLTEAQETQLNAMAEKHALILGDINRENNKIEEQKQKYEEIMRLLERNRADQIALGNDNSLNANDKSAYQQILNDEYAEIEALINSANLNPDQMKSVKQLTQSREDDRSAKVKEYIDLLKLQYDYEKKAAKEDNGSKMQSFYNEQIAKVKDKLQKTDIQALANQNEKNKLLELEAEQQRTIAEIQAQRLNSQQKKQNKEVDKQLFIPQDKKIQDRFDAGYLNKGQYDNWQRELIEYQNYITGVTKVDEATIKNKKQSLTQMYDMLIKMSNASKSFFASGGEILPKEMWFDKSQIDDMSTSLMNLYNNIVTDRFEGMATSVTRVQGELGKLTFTVNDGSGSLAQYTIHANKATGATKLLGDSTKPTLTVLQKFGQTLKKDFTGLLTAVMGGTSIHTFVQYMRQGVQFVRELDLALTELKKVTDATEETYDKFLDTAAQTGARIGRTITDVTSATAEFAKLGYEINTAADMAESALVYANVGDNVDVETGSQSIISTMKAFGIEANNTMSIVDKFNEVGNNFAITTKGIGDALQVSASAMAAAGNTLDETIALTTAANTIVQNPNTVGTALKTLSLRIRGVKTELEEAGLETEGMAETTSQLQAKLLALTDGKVNIMLDANNFKNTTQILREMSAEWENLTDVEQAAALELLGGKRQANTLSAIISNFDIVEDAIEASANSGGSALEENAKVLDSIQGRINLFNNALQTMWNNALDSDLIKGIVNFGTEVVKVVDKLGLLNTVLLTLGTFKGLKSLSKSLGISEIINDTLKATNALELLDVETRKVTLEMITEGLQTKLASSALVEYAVKMGLATAADVAKMSTTQLLGLGFQALGTAIWSATKAMVAFLLTNPIGQLILLTGALAGGVALVNLFSKSTEELKEELSDLKSELSNLRSELDSLNSELETTQSRMAELLAMDSLSFTEQEELKNLQKQNNELERQIYLLEQKEKRKQKETENTFNEFMDTETQVGTVSVLGGGASITEWVNLDTNMTLYKQYMEAESVARNNLVVAEQDGNEKEIKKAQKKLEKAEKRTRETRELIDAKIQEYTDVADGIDYDLADNDTKKYLDDIYNLEDKLHIISGDDKAKSIAITRIFNKDEFAEASNAIDELVKQLEKDPTNNGIKNQIQSIIENNTDLKTSLDEVGLSTIEATDYFTMFASNTAFDTIDGKIKEISEASTIFEQLFSADGYRDVTKEMEALGDAYNNLVNGNVDYNRRPFVSPEEIKKMYPEFDGEIGTTWDMDETYGDGKGGIKYTLKFTPILENGTVLDENSYNEYINNIFTELDNNNGDISKALEYDAANYNILINWQEGAVEYDDEGLSELDRQLDSIKQQHWELAKNIEPIKVEDLFNTDGKVNQIKLSEIFDNTSDEMRQDITSILEGSYDDIKDGTVKIEDLLTKFSLKTTAQFLKVQNNIISNQNKEWFPGLEDEISGIIDTFDELATAVGSIVDAMDTLEQARKEEAYSGSVSIETLSKLMEYTDDYSKIVSIDETGAIHLAANAQEVLIQEKINAIRVNAEAAVKEAELAYQNALAAESSVSFADVIAGSTIPQLDELAGAIAYAGSILGDLEAAMADGFGGVTFSASSAMAKAESAYSSKISSRQSVRSNATSEAAEALRIAQDNLKIANGITADNIQTRYSADKASGKDKDDAFQKAMDYWENRIAANQSRYDQIQNEIDLIESQGGIAGEEYYQEQIKLENERLKLLEAQKAEAQRFLGTFKEGSDEWFKYKPAYEGNL